MKVVATVVATVLLVSLVGALCAEAYPRKHKYHAKRYYHRYASPEVGSRPRYPQPGEWYEHIADKLPIGSSIWWEQMRREGRVGK